MVNVEDGLNVRIAPGLDREIIANVPLGETVTATGNTVDGWTEVLTNGIIGWASTDRLSSN